jgi:transposase-like protein
MTKKRQQYSPEYKFKVALEAAKGTKTLAEITGETGMHANQISQWKSRLLDAGASLFRRDNNVSQREREQLEAELYEQIGRLKMELAWLKKKIARFN